MKYVSFILFWLIAGSSVGQDVEFNAAVSSNVVSTDDQIVLEYTANAKGEIIPPDFKDIRVLQGPFSFSSASAEYINGQYSVQQTVTVKYVIRPTKEGKITIPPAKLRYGGKYYESNSIELNVSKGSEPVPQQHSVDPQRAEQDVIAMVYLSKNEVYEGESVLATYKVFSPFQFYRLNDFKPGANTGFYTQEIDLNLRNNTYDVQRETINGKMMYSITLRKELLIPQDNGELKLEPFSVDMHIVKGRGFRARTAQANATSNTPTLNVKKLPAPPDDFCGVVGNLNMSTEVSRTHMKANEGFDLSVTVSGKGNLKFMDDPEPNFPSEFEVYDPEKESNVATTSLGMKGSITYRFLVVPRIYGEFDLSPVTLSYFDPAKERYIQLEAPKVNLEIERGNLTAESLDTVRSRPKEIESKEDIRYARSSSNLMQRPGSIFGSPVFLGALSFPVILVAILFLLVRIRKQRNDRPNPKANVHHQLKEAARLAEEGKTDSAYAAMLGGLERFVANTLEVPVSEQNKDRIRSAISEVCDASRANRFIELMELCEMARYGMIQEGQLPVTIRQATELLKEIDNEL